MWKLVAASCLVALLTGCGSGGGGNGGSNGHYKKDKLEFGKPLNTLFYALPGGRDLRDQALRYGFRDAVGELEDYSAPDQAPRVPNPAQDIRFLGVSGRYMSDLDLVALNQNFPAGAGTVGYTLRGSMTPLSAGQYMFVSAEFEADIPFDDPAKTLDYAAVFKRTLDPADDWAGNATFTRDTFIGSDYWIRASKAAGEAPRLVVTEVDGTTLTDVTDSQAMAIHMGNALMFIVPASEFPERNFHAPVRVTSFDNIDGNFGRFNDDGWSLDTAPSRDESYFTPSASAFARIAPRIELDVRYVATDRNLISDLGLDLDQSWALEEVIDADPGVANGNLTDFVGETGLFGGTQMLGSLFTANAVRGALLPSVSDMAMGLGDLGVFSGIPGDSDVPFLVNGRDRQDVTGIQFDTSIPILSSTTSLRGDVLGSLIPPDQLASVLAILEALDSPPVQTLIQPRLIAHNRQELGVIGIDWNTPIDNVPSPIQSYYTSVDSGVEYADTGISLTIRPQILADSTIRLELTPAVGVQAESSQTIQVDGVGMRVLLPYFEKQNVRTSITVESGETIVLGGFMEQGQVSVQNGVPWLGDIPILNELFASARHDADKSELLIFVTPRIVNQQ